MFKYYVAYILMLYFVHAEDTVSDVKELETSDQSKEIFAKTEEQTGANLETGKSFTASVPYPPDQLGLGTGYGYIPPQGQFYPIPGHHQPYPYQHYQAFPYFGGAGAYPSASGGFYQNPYHHSPNYLQSYDILYSRRSNNERY